MSIVVMGSLLIFKIILFSLANTENSNINEKRITVIIFVSLMNINFIIDQFFARNSSMELK